MGKSTSSDLLKAAIQEIKMGNIASGQQALSKVIKIDPNSVYAEKAWVWMSATFSDSDQKRKCLESALKINPDNEVAQKGLTKLPPPIPPEELDDTDFDYPEWISDDSSRDEQLTSTSTLGEIKSSNNIVQETQEKRRKSDQQLFDEYIAWQSARGWQIVSRTRTSAQFRRPKQWSKGLLIIGIVLLFFGGIGLPVLLLAVVVYLLQKEEVIFVDVKELRTTVNSTESPSKINYPAASGRDFLDASDGILDPTGIKSNNRSLILKLVFAFIIIFCGLFLFISISNSINSSTNYKQATPSSSYSVTYRITGTENRASVLSGNSANNQPITVELPWQHTVSMKYGDTAALIATGETNKTVKCEIYVNGKLRTSATSSAAMDNMAVCGYVVGRNVPINVVP